MEGIIYITIDQAKVIHAKTIEYSGGGTYEHFDLGRLESVLQNIQNLRDCGFHTLYDLSVGSELRIVNRINLHRFPPY